MKFINLNAVESFYLFYRFLSKSLCTRKDVPRLKVNIPDTFIIKDGEFFSFLFTSKKTGVRTNKNLQTRL